MTNDRDELLQERLTLLAAGEPLDQLLDGLTPDEAESLSLAAAIGALQFNQDSAVRSAQRARILDAGRKQMSTTGSSPAASALSPFWAWLGRPLVFRGAVVAGAGLLVVILLGIIWLNRGRHDSSNLDNLQASGDYTSELSQETSQVELESALGDTFADEGKGEEPSTESAAAPTEGQPETTVEVVPGQQLFVPIIGHALEEAADKAVLSQSHGLIEVATIDGAWTPVAGPILLQAGHFIRTGRLSSATLTFFDGSQARIGPGSQLSIDRLNALRPKDGFRAVVLTQQSGITDHAVQFRHDAGSLYQVKTPTGSGIARGTRFRVQVDADAQVSYTVSEGKVDVSNANRTISVRAGQQTSFAAEEAPGSPEFWVTGTGFVDKIGDSTWTIGRQTFVIEEDTVILGNPKINDFVYVEGHLDNDDRVAELIRLQWSQPENHFTLIGEVKTMGQIWSVAGQAISVTVDTLQDPGIEVGNRVRVTGTIQQSDGRLIAETIELLNDGIEMPFEYVGVVQSLEEPWRVSDIVLELAENAEVDADIVVGDAVNVEGFIVAGVWIAHEIQLLEKDEATFAFTGKVISNINPTWNVAGVSFLVDSFTQSDDDIGQGDTVRVSGVILEDGTWLAQTIEKLDGTLLDIVFVGTVDDRSEEPWIISGLPIFTVGADIDMEITVGDLVRVTALIQSDGTWLARRIERINRSVPDGCVTVTAVVTGITGDAIVLSDGQTINLDAAIIVAGELSVNSVVAIVACANDDGTIDIISITVVYNPVDLPPPDDDDETDEDGRQEARVTICHKPGTPAEKTMSLPQSATSGHLGHGDTLGACRDS